MSNQETAKERKKRFKEMSSDQRKALIREKMKAEGLIEGSGVPGKSLSSYDEEEVWDLIQITSCLPEMQATLKAIKSKPSAKKRSLIAWVLFVIALTCGFFIYCDQYPSPSTRRNLSVDGIFMD